VVDLIELDTAFAIAKWSGLGLIGFNGHWAARFSGAPVSRALVQAAMVAAAGGALIEFKVLLHRAPARRIDDVLPRTVTRSSSRSGE